MILIVIILFLQPRECTILTRFVRRRSVATMIIHVVFVLDFKKNFSDRLQVLQDVGLTVPERGIFGLISPDGAERTTVFDFDHRFLAPSSGCLALDDRPLNKIAPIEYPSASMGRTLRCRRFRGEMSLNKKCVGRDETTSALAPSCASPCRRRVCSRRNTKSAREAKKISSRVSSPKGDIITATFSSSRQNAAWK